MSEELDEDFNLKIVSFKCTTRQLGTDLGGQRGHSVQVGHQFNLESHWIYFVGQNG